MRIQGVIVPSVSLFTLFFGRRYLYDRDTAVHVDPKIQRGLFLFACTNSCMNPIVYGAFNIRARRTVGRTGGGGGGQVRRPPPLNAFNSLNCGRLSNTRNSSNHNNNNNNSINVTRLPPIELTLRTLE